MQKQANSSDRHPAVVKGQEDLTGVKEVRIKRVLKRNTDNEVVVSQSTRYEMLYDSVEEAERAYKNIIDAQEVAEFDNKKEDNMDFDKDAHIHTGMQIKGCRVGVYNPLNDTYEISSNGCTATISGRLLKIAASNENMGVCAKCGAIYPLVDTGIGGVSNNPTQDPTDFAKGGEGQAHTLCPFCGKSTQLDIEQPGTFMPDTFGRGTHKIPACAKSAQAENESLIQPGFKVSPMEHELQLGVNREHEHTNRPDQALEIAIDHLAEDPKYYTKLNQVLPEEGKEEKPQREVSVTEADNDNVDAIIEHGVKSAAKVLLSKLASVSKEADSAVVDETIRERLTDPKSALDLLCDHTITRKDGLLFTEAVYKAIEDGFYAKEIALSLLEDKIVTNTDGELFSTVVHRAIEEDESGKGYADKLLQSGIITEKDGNLYNEVVNHAMENSSYMGTYPSTQKLKEDRNWQNEEEPDVFESNGDSSEVTSKTQEILPKQACYDTYSLIEHAVKSAAQSLLSKQAGAYDNVALLDVEAIKKCTSVEEAKQKAADMFSQFYPNESWAGMHSMQTNKMNTIEEIADYVQQLKLSNSID